MPDKQKDSNFFLTNDGKQVFVEEGAYDTLSIKEIINFANAIDINKVSSEILEWLAKNVEMFIDNKERFYHIDMIIEDNDPEGGVKMDESRKLQTLYRSIPDAEDKLAKCHNILDDVTSNIMSVMKNDTKGLKSLFDRMIYYYELQGFYKGQMIEKELIGEVGIHLFEYESFSIGVRVSESKILVEGKVHNLNDDKSYVIPEGFIIEFEISFRENSDPASLF